MFEWDDANVEHIAEHDIYPEEAEDVMTDARRVNMGAYNTPTEKRRAVVGKTSGGRYLFVAFTRRQGLFRVVTARDVKESEKRLYRRRA